MHSAAIRIRSAFIPSRMQRNPSPSAPMRFSAGNLEIVEEELVRLVVHHVLDPAHASCRAVRRRAGRREKQRVRRVFFLTSIERGRAREQQHEIRMLHARDPHFLPVHDVAVAAPLGDRFDFGRVGAGRRLGDRERLKPERARRDLRQIMFSSAPPIRAAAACP